MFDADGDDIDELDFTPASPIPVVIDHGVRDRLSASGSASASASIKSDRHTAAEDVEVNEKDDLETVEITHPVARSDTLLAIARRYAADVSTAPYLISVCTPTWDMID